MSVEKLRSWGVRVIDVNRLVSSSNLLKQVHQTGQYPDSPDLLVKIARAIQDAHDFRYIGACIPPERLEPIAVELQRAVGGASVDAVEDRMPYQFQSQYLVGAILAFGGVEPIIPIPGDKSYPDFYFLNGTLYYGVEVKRPSAPGAAAKLVRKAGRQLATLKLHSGAIVLDLSECVPNTVEFHTGDAKQSRNIFESKFASLAEALEDIVWDDDIRRRKKGFHNVGVVVSFARIMSWNLNDLSFPILQQRCRFAALNEHGANTLLGHRNRWLIDVFYDGFQLAGYEMARDT